MGDKEEVPTVVGFYVEGLSNDKSFRNAQAKEPEFRAVLKTC